MHYALPLPFSQAHLSPARRRRLHARGRRWRQHASRRCRHAGVRRRLRLHTLGDRLLAWSFTPRVCTSTCCCLASGMLPHLPLSHAHSESRAHQARHHRCPALHLGRRLCVHKHACTFGCGLAVATKCFQFVEPGSPCESSSSSPPAREGPAPACKPALPPPGRPSSPSPAHVWSQAPCMEFHPKSVHDHMLSPGLWHAAPPALEPRSL